MASFQTLPLLWLLSDARNDSVLEQALAALPRGSAMVFRHYHLDNAPRRRRFDKLATIARAHHHLVVLAGDAACAAAWGADGIYGRSAHLHRTDGLLRLASAHTLEELKQASRAAVDGIFLSPVFPTRSHPGAAWLGPARFHALAAKSRVPVIALGGMSHARALELDWPRWGAIDGLNSRLRA